jgi:hypothetical protein
MTSPPLCKHPTCNNVVERTKRNDKWKTYCSSECQKHSHTIRVENNVKRTGHKNPIDREKLKKKWINKYGVDNPAKAQSVKDKVKKTFEEKYDGHPMFDFGIKEKVATTLRQSKMSQETIQILDNKDLLIEMNCHHSVTQIAEKLCVAYSTVYKKLIEHHGKIIRHSPAIDSRSNFEKEIEDFVKSFGYTTIINDRSILNGSELDILIPEKNLAIECNGTYWHSESAGLKDRRYHLLKTNKCKEQGIQLFHLWQHEWNRNSKLIKSRLQSKLGINNRIFARKCDVMSITAPQANSFCKKNHIQGSCPASVNLGLFCNLELVAVMTFGKSRYDKNIEWELLRYCSKQGVNVVGGAGKLFKKFKTDCNPAGVISYSDRMRNDGKVYNAIGFEYSHSTGPSYYYTRDYVTFENRVAYQKHKLIDKLETFDPNLTEWENMKLNGFDRIWDCGNDVYKWIK